MDGLHDDSPLVHILNVWDHVETVTSDHGSTLWLLSVVLWYAYLFHRRLDLIFTLVFFLWQNSHGIWHAGVLHHVILQVLAVSFVLTGALAVASLYLSGQGHGTRRAKDEILMRCRIQWHHAYRLHSLSAQKSFLIGKLVPLRAPNTAPARATLSPFFNPLTWITVRPEDHLIPSAPPETLTSKLKAFLRSQVISPPCRVAPI
jgi:hypothetical protein